MCHLLSYGSPKCQYLEIFFSGTGVFYNPLPLRNRNELRIRQQQEFHENKGSHVQCSSSHPTLQHITPTSYLEARLLWFNFSIEDTPGNFTCLRGWNKETLDWTTLCSDLNNPSSLLAHLPWCLVLPIHHLS